MMKLSEACKIIGVGENTVKEWGSLGRIKIDEVNGEFFVKEEELDRFIEKFKVKLVTPEDHKEVLMKTISDLNGGQKIYKDEVNKKDIEGFLNSFKERENILSEEEIQKLIQENTK